MHADVKRVLAPKCWITSVQLIKVPGYKAINSLFGINFPVHYVVKYTPCSGKGPDWKLDAYTGPTFEPLAKDDQIDE